MIKITNNPKFHFLNIMQNERMIQIKNRTILINIQHYNLDWIKEIKQRHQVHIFITKFADPFYGDDGFYDFCDQVYQYTGKKVIIHVFTENKNTKYEIESRLFGFNEYKIVIDDRNTRFTMYERNGNVFALYVGLIEVDRKYSTIAFVSNCPDKYLESISTRKE